MWIFMILLPISFLSLTIFYFEFYVKAIKDLNKTKDNLKQEVLI
jgi:hypothetical protein